MASRENLDISLTVTDLDRFQERVQRKATQMPSIDSSLILNSHTLSGTTMKVKCLSFALSVYTYTRTYHIYIVHVRSCVLVRAHINTHTYVQTH